jgi:hypothetical protein
MPQVGFELMFPVFERMNTVHAPDGAATVIGVHLTLCFNITIREKEKEKKS